MARDHYVAQVHLIVKILPVIAEEADFALKGGTAINLFHRDLPRLSVDIDLTYLPIRNRDASLKSIDKGFDSLTSRLNRISGVTAKRIHGGGAGQTRIQVSAGGALVKIEVSPVSRGTVLPTDIKRVCPSVEDEFGFAEIQLVSFEDLYAGKIHAALDRQHPRDLFDVDLLYKNEGITDRLFRVFLVYIAGSNRPLHEILNPNPVDLSEAFEKEFSGMTSFPVELSDIEAVREKLIADIQSRLTGSSADFLRSLQAGTPEFQLISLPKAALLPAVKWKQLNLQKLMKNNPAKYEHQTTQLEVLL